MILLIDNYDSFSYNLYQLIGTLTSDIKVIRNDEMTVEEIEALNPAKIILSPGPKSPADCGNCKEILKRMAGKVPILGVCLGHQIIGHVFGATVKKGNRPMHGKVTAITTDGTGLFQNLPDTYQVTRYHSLVISDEKFPEELQVNARSEDGVIMGIRHRKMPVYGVQFHPEAVLTEYGHELLRNYTKICREWWSTYENSDSQIVLL